MSMSTGSEKSLCYSLFPIFSAFQQVDTKHLHIQPPEGNRVLMQRQIMLPSLTKRIHFVQQKRGRTDKTLSQT